MAAATAPRWYLDLDRHPIGDPAYADRCAATLDAEGVLVLEKIFTDQAVARVVAESAPREHEAYYAGSTHNVYLTDRDPSLSDDHPFNRQVTSSKGLLADDQLPADSPLRHFYADGEFRRFLCSVLGVDEIHPNADDLSPINVHFASAGRELGWHFDNSSFAVTMLLQAPEAGAVFEYVPEVRDADAGDMGFARVADVLDGAAPVRRLRHGPGDLVLFRGRNALHRVTPTEGSTTRILTVFAYNSRPEVALSDSALSTFYGRTS